MRRIAITGLLLAMVAGGCENGADDGIGIDATGVVEGLAWIDRNGDGVLQGTADGPVEGVRIQLLGRTGSRVLYSTETGPAGEFIVRSVMVGDYRTVVDSSSVGDTIRVLRVDSANPTISAGDTAVVVVGFTFPHATTDSVRAAPLDRTLFVEGRVISEWDTFGDASIHIRDETGALRSLRVEANNASLGDEVRLLGATSLQADRPVLKDVRVFLLETGVELPDPVAVSTATAARADDGRLDADLVRVTGAAIQDTLRNSFNEFILRVDDGSGTLDVVLDRDIPFFLNLPPDTILGLPVNASGILLPPASGATDTWVLKPREGPDLQVQAP